MPYLLDHSRIRDRQGSVMADTHAFCLVQKVALVAVLCLPAYGAAQSYTMMPPYPTDVTGRNLHEAVQGNSSYKGIMAPTALHHRYLREDIPCSLVPMISIGEQYGVDTPTMRSVAHLGSLLLGEDVWAEGRTV